ncbi:MAG: NAD(P)-dependent oxidoreductase [Verrucomicrobiota bacterium]
MLRCVCPEEISFASAPRGFLVEVTLRVFGSKSLREIIEWFAVGYAGTVEPSPKVVNPESNFMALSFSAKPASTLAEPGGQRRRVLVTGAAGRIGAYFAEHAKDRYDLRLMVHRESSIPTVQAFGEVLVADLVDLDRLKAAFQGIDTIVHLAGNPSPSAPWGSLLEENIVGTYHVYVAAKAAGCRRVVFASSIHAVSGYPPDVQVKTTDPVNPGDLYGVTKCFGEALGRYMAMQEGLSVIAVRIGAFQSEEAAEQPDALWMMDAFVSQADLHQLLEKCIDAENLQFAIFNGLSNNRFKRLDISDARELVGYAPVDDFTEENAVLAPIHLREQVWAHSRLDPDEESGLREDL